MSNVRWGRIFGGGLLAGLIINVGEFLLNDPILGSQFESAMEARNMEPPGGSAIAVFVLMGFALGILTVWLYAAIRPRLGAGPKTAACAGSFVWALSYLYPNVSFLVMDFFPSRLLLLATAWGLVEIVLATVAGAWLYKEA